MAIDWGAAKRSFEREGLTFEEVAGRQGCKAETVRRHALSDGWKRRPCRLCTSPNIQTTPGEVVKSHRRLWKGLRKKVGTEIEKDEVVVEKELKVATDVLNTIIKGERQAWGLIDTADEVKRDETGHITKEMEYATVPPGAGKALDRK